MSVRRRPFSHLSVLIASLALAACGDNTGTLPAGEPLDQIAGYSGRPTMNPGLDCRTCHTPGGNGSDRLWKVAGTVFRNPVDPGDGGLEGVQIMVTDVNGKQLTMLSNDVGNFYTAEDLGPLTDIEIQKGKVRMVMNLAVFDGGDLAVVGSCNHCHQAKGINGAPGRVFLPRGGE